MKQPAPTSYSPKKKRSEVEKAEDFITKAIEKLREEKK